MRVIQDRYHAVLLSESAIPCGEDVLAIMISLSNCHNAARYGTPQLEAYIDCLAAQVLQPEELRCGALERNTRSFNGTDFASHKPVSLKPHMFTTGPSQRSSQTRGLLLLSLSLISKSDRRERRPRLPSAQERCTSPSHHPITSAAATATATADGGYGCGCGCGGVGGSTGSNSRVT